MAQESCNLDKEEAEILKPSSSSGPLPPPPPAAPASPSSSPRLLKDCTPEFSLKRRERPEEDPPAKEEEEEEEEEEEDKGEERAPRQRAGNRCTMCRRKVGLTGFRCRCGELFCGPHRYSDAHGCPFDYKAMGREEIAKANPVVRAAKIIKI